MPASTPLSIAATGDRVAAVGRTLMLIVLTVGFALNFCDAPGRPPPAASMTGRLARTVRLPATWTASALYAVAFGGFVAFSVYLPSSLRTAYDLSGERSPR